MSSRIRELADFLRDDPSILCAADGADEMDPYTAAAKRILFRVYLIELPAAARQQAAALAPAQGGGGPGGGS